MNHHLGKFQSLGVFIALLLLCLIFTITSPHFLTTENIFSTIRSVSFVAILAMGETFAIITGGIDLSVGSLLGFCGCLSALLIHVGWPWLCALAAGLGAGALLGCVNGQLITRLKLPPFIVTLGMYSMARGLTFVITKGWPVSGLPPAYMQLGQGYWWVIPLPVIFMILTALLSGLFLNYTRTGRQIFAIGGNETAAILSGVPVQKVKVIVYSTSGLLAALAGILLVARLGVAQPTSGVGFELDAIAAAVIGGTSLMGGKGTIIGLLIGAAIMGVLRNGLILLGLSAFWQQFAIGLVIILAVAIDKWRK
jgi:ribose transport system permease protein